MSVKTSSLSPFRVTSIPDRLTPIWVADPTVVTTTAGGTCAAKRINRLQSASFSNDTGVIEISEMGTQARVGGVDDLGEVKFKLGFNGVGMTNMAAITGTTINQTSNATTSIGLTQFQSSTVDIFRFVADSRNNIFQTLYIQDAVIDEYDIDVKVKGLLSEAMSGMGPNATVWPGFVLPKTYLVQGADVTANVCVLPLADVLGASEAPVEIYLPSAGSPPSYWQQNGTKYFFKVELVQAANLANNPVRFYEAGAVSASTVVYDNTAKTLTFPANAVVAGDLIRLVFLSYNCDSFPTSVPQQAPDTTDRYGVHSRTIPITINGLGTTRIESASIKFSMKRDQVQGVGENSIIYGVPQIPDVSIDLEVKESDIGLLSALSTGSKNLTSQGGTIANDFQELSYITRSQLANAQPFVITLHDPFDVSKILVTYTCPQLVVKGIDFSSSNKSDNTIKFTAMDIQGLMTATYTHP